jgi:hypothetical protein
MNDIQKEAQKLIYSGFGVTRIIKGFKKPTEPRWTLNSVDSSRFKEDDQLAILGGPLSKNLVIIDLDGENSIAHSRLIKLASVILPKTDMRDGRTGRHNAHWFYRMKPFPWIDSQLPDKTSQIGQAMREGQIEKFIGSRHIVGKDGMKLDFIGAGGQVVVPPSLNTSGYKREWVGGKRGEPRLINWVTLKNSLNELTQAIGYKPKFKPLPSIKAFSRVTSDSTSLHRVKSYLQKCEGGKGDGSGGGTCLKVCGAVAVGFGLKYQAIPVLIEWANNLSQPYSKRDLERAVDKAMKTTNRPFGHLLEVKKWKMN